ncbi:MAG TPA: GNAT family N-acetyltransferase [Ideonella sp.]|nr:GNAT family N-acetyltransferase [Ideonella sp.]
MTAHIRPAEPRDVADLVRLITALAQYESLTHLLQLTEEKLAAQLFGARPAAEAVVAEVTQDGAVRCAGFGLYFTTFSTFLCQPSLYLEDLFVLPEFRGRQIGKSIWQHLARTAAERGCGRFEWCVLDWNEPAIRFYEGMGATLLPDWRLCRVTGEALQRLGATPA